MALSGADVTLPPGTTLIEDITGKSARIILSPQPTADPNQPLNWSSRRKCIHMIILSFYALMIFAILCVPPPLWGQINEELGISFKDLNDAYATSQGTLALGCIIFVPFGLKYGRRPVYILTALIMLASSVWFGKVQSRGDLYGANVICGLAGAVNEALFQVTVADLFFVHQRGTMNGIFIVIVLLGNYLGPVASGYVAVSQGWRWVYWYTTIFMGISCITVIFSLEESKYALAPHARTQSLSEATHITEKGDQKHIGIAKESEQLSTSSHGPIREIQIDPTIPIKSYWQRHAFMTFDKEGASSTTLLMHIYQPFLILVQFPAMMFAALQWGWVIGMLVVLAVVQATLYPGPPYNFSAAGVGLQNLPPAIGAVLGSMFGGPLNDFFILQVAKRRRGVYEPESRLYLFMFPGLCMTIGTLLFGLTIAKVCRSDRG